MRVILCEDDPQQRRFLQSTILQYTSFHETNIELVLCAAKPEEVMTYLTDHQADCYFLDIELDAGINGLELAQFIREKDPLANIIFITTFADKLKLTFTYKLAALDYILKEAPNLKDNIISALQVAYEKYEQIHFKEETGFFALKIGEFIKKVRFEDIYYFETSHHAHKVILREINGFYEFYGNLKEIEEKIDERFFRCHRSYLINLDYIEKLDMQKKQVFLKNGTICDVSYRYWKNLKQHFLQSQLTGHK
ncbi:LytR/AlgR family response regulator transcription factor [Schinkia azotoformans]|uniref:LytR/AlgR family response regulator transcription factor n=1 Tax=Schinkia azotoformans TaxID=1454 RepID=UPI002DBF011D|nr:LytTR family DNA-binding domain-containing protein [Schinkia azotoformans]MEC1771137.1 LytTR family DNA-binding domain-containing protein [Schinkia azotoformans]MED4364986.1 LytTR family DNA-binding domain-containing protein [Schinkia azotoformans]